MKTIEYFAPGFVDIDDVEDYYGPIWDSTSLQKIADCPRYFEIKVMRGLDRRGGASPKMAAGIAIHEAMEYYYSLAAPTEADERKAIEEMQVSFDSYGFDRALMDPKDLHLTIPHLTGIMEGYFDHYVRTVVEIYDPVHLTIDDLDLSKVVAAKFKLNDDGLLILGESNIVMLFDVPGHPEQQLLFAGKPDLPVRSPEGLAVMDHKSTSMSLSDFWAKQFEVSNKMRIYMAMIREMLHETPSQAVINGIYVGQYALNPKSTATKFHRFAFDFSPDHIDESIVNWWSWKKLAGHFAERGYYPQGCAFGGCQMPRVCTLDPDTREEILATEWEPSTRTFWGL